MIKISKFFVRSAVGLLACFTMLCPAGFASPISAETKLDLLKNLYFFASSPECGGVGAGVIVSAPVVFGDNISLAQETRYADYLEAELKSLLSDFGVSLSAKGNFKFNEQIDRLYNDSASAENRVSRSYDVIIIPQIWVQPSGGFNIQIEMQSHNKRCQRSGNFGMPFGGMGFGQAKVTFSDINTLIQELQGKIIFETVALNGKRYVEFHLPHELIELPSTCSLLDDQLSGYLLDYVRTRKRTLFSSREQRPRLVMPSGESAFVACFIFNANVGSSMTEQVKSAYNDQFVASDPGNDLNSFRSEVEVSISLLHKLALEATSVYLVKIK